MSLRGTFWMPSGMLGDHPSGWTEFSEKIGGPKLNDLRTESLTKNEPFGAPRGGGHEGGFPEGADSGAKENEIFLEVLQNAFWSVFVPKRSHQGFIFFRRKSISFFTHRQSARAIFDQFWTSRNASQRTGTARDASQDIQKTSSATTKWQYLTRRVKKVISECSRNCLNIDIFSVS